jgi:2-keto-4-pentenoate hydratase
MLGQIWIAPGYSGASFAKVQLENDTGFQYLSRHGRSATFRQAAKLEKNMSLTDEDVRSIASAFRSARFAARALNAYPGPLPDALDDAYRIQDAAISRWEDTVAGWKIGGIAPALQSRYGGATRLTGPVFRRAVQYATPGEVVHYPVFEGGFSAVEAEVIIVIGQDCAPGECPPGHEIELVDTMCLGIETAGSPLATINDLGPCVVISDFGNNHGLIVGPQIAGWREPGFGRTPITTTIDGVMVGSGCPDAITGGPVSSLAFLLGVLTQRGHSLSRGDLVTTGAVTGIHSVQAGARARVEMPNVGIIEVQATRDAGAS